MVQVHQVTVIFFTPGFNYSRYLVLVHIVYHCIICVVYNVVAYKTKKTTWYISTMHVPPSSIKEACKILNADCTVEYVDRMYAVHSNV